MARFGATVGLVAASNRKDRIPMGFSAFRQLLISACTAALGVSALAQTVPTSTAIPVVLTRTIASASVRPGDSVRAKTLQAVLLPGGHAVPAGTVLTGHIVAASAFHFDATPYAAQTPSVLSIHFDSIAIPNTISRVSSIQVAAVPGGVVPVRLELRAIAGPVASHEAETPHGLDETDWSATRTLVGGDTTSLDKTVVASDGSIVGYSRSQGVYARLLASVSAADPQVTCDGGSMEQSVALFSPDACGVYGLNSIALAGNGAGDGTFILESRQRSVRIDAGTTALLEVLPQ